jgi:hypothetical protein
VQGPAVLYNIHAAEVGMDYALIFILVSVTHVHTTNIPGLVYYIILVRVSRLLAPVEFSSIGFYDCVPDIL